MPASMAARVSGSSAIVVKSERHLDTFRAGLKSFVNEARLLARFDHPSLVKVLPLLGGERHRLHGDAVLRGADAEGGARRARPRADRGRAARLAAAAARRARRDARARSATTATSRPTTSCSPPRGPLLLDFGAARRVIGDMTQALTVVLKPGYAPIEQYGDVATMTQGPWTDLYALASVVYYAITGKTPTSSVERLMDDRLEPLAVTAAGRYSEAFLRAIDAALAVRPGDRPQTEREFRALLDADLPAAAAHGAAAPPAATPLPIVRRPTPAPTPDRTVPGTLTAGAGDAAGAARGDRGRRRRDGVAARRRRIRRRVVDVAPPSVSTRRSSSDDGVAPAPPIAEPMRVDFAADARRVRAPPTPAPIARRDPASDALVGWSPSASSSWRRSRRTPGCSSARRPDDRRHRRVGARRRRPPSSAARRRRRRRARPGPSRRPIPPPRATPAPASAADARRRRSPVPPPPSSRRRTPRRRRADDRSPADPPSATIARAAPIERAPTPPAGERTPPSARRRSRARRRRRVAPRRTGRPPRPRREAPTPRRRRARRQGADASPPRRSRRGAVIFCKRPRSSRSRPPRPTISRGNADEGPAEALRRAASACARRASPPSSPARAPRRAAARRRASARWPFEQAVAQATDGLVGARRQKGPTFLARLAKRSIVLDPMLDAATGQQTAATTLLETRVSERLTAKADMFEILPFQSANLSKAQYLLTGTMTRVDGDGTAKKRALQIQLALTDLKTRHRRRAGVGAGARRRPRPHAARLLPRQPGAGEGQGDRRLRANVGDAAGPARRRVLPRAHRRGDADQRGDVALQPGALRRGARPLSQRAGDADRRAAARRQRHLPGERQARPHGRGRAGVRPRRRARHRLQRARREVPLQPGQHRVLVRPEGERRLPDVAAPDRAREHRREGLHEHRRPHQPHRLGAAQRHALAAARQLHPRSASPPKRSRWPRRRRPAAWAFARTSSAAAPTTPSTRSTAASSSGSFPARRPRAPRERGGAAAALAPLQRLRRRARRPRSGTCRAFAAPTPTTGSASPSSTSA